MNDFNPKEIKKASVYLQDKLEDIKGIAKESIDLDDKVKEEVKPSKLKRFVSSIFKR